MRTNNDVLGAGGYDLCEVAENQWAMNVKGGPVFTGTFKKVVIHAVTHLGFDLEEIEFGVQQMLNSGDNVAHFGIHRTFIFTIKREFSNDRKAS